MTQIVVIVLSFFNHNLTFHAIILLYYDVNICYEFLLVRDWGSFPCWTLGIFALRLFAKYTIRALDLLVHKRYC